MLFGSLAISFSLLAGHVALAKHRCERGEFLQAGECHDCMSVCTGNNVIDACRQCWSGQESSLTTVIPGADTKNDINLIQVDKNETKRVTTPKKAVKAPYDIDLKVEVEKIENMQTVTIIITTCVFSAVVVCGILLGAMLYGLKKMRTLRQSGNSPVKTEARYQSGGQVKISISEDDNDGHSPIQDHQSHSSSNPNIMEQGVPV
ncbi:uncharacterized protein LOC144350427 [Saccoglossus kowalevskii]